MIQDVMALEKIERYNAINKRLNECIVSNLVAVRKRSMETWRTAPIKIVSLAEVIRPLCEQEYFCQQQITRCSIESPMQNLPVVNIESEIKHAMQCRRKFLSFVRGLSEYELINRQLTFHGFNVNLISFLFHISFEEILSTEKLLQASNTFER